MERVGSHQVGSTKVRHLEYYGGRLIEVPEFIKEEINRAFEFWNNSEPDIEYDYETHQFDDDSDYGDYEQIFDNDCEYCGQTINNGRFCDDECEHKFDIESECKKHGVSDDSPLTINILSGIDTCGCECVIQLYGFEINCFYYELEPIDGIKKYENDNYICTFNRNVSIDIEDKNTNVISKLVPKRGYTSCDKFKFYIKTYKDNKVTSKLKYVTYPIKRISKVKRAN